MEIPNQAHSKHPEIKPRPGWPFYKSPICNFKTKPLLSASHRIRAAGVENIYEVCEKLWDHLSSFPCFIFNEARCYNNDGYLDWYFSSGPWCNAGYANAAWWEATKNKYGAIDCRNPNQPIEQI
ncbi:hypothetical protein CCHL11_09262 [Colletotrichum chlorophyti]|uniref:Uncharacterized protein n=1 Tax=Colletotrichum chlorophyti TaxID=708187 RepID=A0A1Q8RCK5_9PEZI|nr:hypothetical protein CCHL11_09262 [Colletotrichum chlorophyti]